MTKSGHEIALTKAGMVRITLLISTICSLLVLGYFLPKWTGPKNCINSSLVKEISIEGSSEIYTGCDLRTKSLTESPPQWVQLAELLERIDSLEFLDSYWPYTGTKIHIHVKLKHDSQSGLGFRDQILLLDAHSILDSEKVEKALISYWVGITDPLVSQVVTNFLWNSHFIGGLTTEKPTNAEYWLKYLVSLRSYCGLKVNTLRHEEFCDVQRELGESLVSIDEDEGSVHWSLHIVLSRILEEVFQRVKLEEKRSFVQRLIFLNQIDEPYPWANLSRLNSLTEIDVSFWRQVRHMFSSLDVSLQELWSATVSHLLTRSNDKFQYVIVDGDIQWSVPSSVKGPNVFIEYQGKKFLFPSDAPLQISREHIFKNLKIESLSLISCETPKAKKLLELESIAKKVLFVRVCNEDPKQVATILAQTPRKYIQLNKSMEFIEFNLAALKFTAEKKGLKANLDQIKDWGEWLEWQDFVYDSSNRAFRPRAVFDAIQLFRSPELSPDSEKLVKTEDGEPARQPTHL